MRVLIVHNAYQQRGGEDSVVDSEAALLRRFGHDVELMTRHNDDVAQMSSLALVKDTFWSAKSAQAFKEVAAAFQPDVVHVHNTFPLVSPSVYWAAGSLRLPVVQTLHNFRLMCPQAMFLREGKVCEDCLGKLPWRGAVRGCYRGSVAQSTVLASMVSAHRLMGTWQHKVRRYIALNEFCRQKFIAGGLPAERVVIKPNFVESGPCAVGPRHGFLFVGRLSPEKGADVLAHAAGRAPELVVRVAGTGPEAAVFNGLANVDLLGSLAGGAVMREMAGASALVLPSIWYENFPRTLVEAFASGLPVIASRIGALADIVEDGVTGLLFEPGNGEDLAQKMQWMAAHPDKAVAMGLEARRRYEQLYSPEVNVRQLVEIYDAAIADNPGGRAHA